MLFSGHAGTSVLCTCFCISTYIPKWFKALILATGICGVFVCVLVGDHYTVDVLVATYISLFVWKLFEDQVNKSYTTKSNDYIETKNGPTTSKKIN